MIGSFHEVLNFGQLFLKLNRFIYNELASSQFPPVHSLMNVDLSVKTFAHLHLRSSEHDASWFTNYRFLYRFLEAVCPPPLFTNYRFLYRFLEAICPPPLPTCRIITIIIISFIISVRRKNKQFNIHFSEYTLTSLTSSMWQSKCMWY